MVNWNLKVSIIIKEGKAVLKRKAGYERKKSLYGFLFVSPWIIGFVLFFLIPFVQSLLFSFSNVSMTNDGFDLKFTGIQNYRYIFFESEKYINNLVESFYAFVYKVPIIIILALIIAVVLNGNFKGRTFFRSVYFVPVIVSTGVVMQYIMGDAVLESMRISGGEAVSSYANGLIDFDAVFAGLGLPTDITNVIMNYLEDIFNLVWSCGIQIVLYISGLQSIPAALYEVSKVEGATKWEEFWYVTIPMLRHSILLVAVFTAIDFCGSNDNKVMKQAYTILTGQQNYNESSAMMWAFFAVIGILFGLVILIVQKKIFKKWD